MLVASGQGPGKLAVALTAVAVVFFTAVSSNVFAASNESVKDRRVDAVSLECINCHMNRLTPENQSREDHYSGYDHVIGIDYASYAADGSLTLPNALNPALKLIDGRISCVTCHVGYNPNDHEGLAKQRRKKGSVYVMLTIDNKGSALCLSCHNK